MTPFSPHPLAILLMIAVFLYFCQTIFLYIGTHKSRRPGGRKTSRMSVLVAVRDEDRTLRDCIDSLLQLDYPKEALEIILIDDRSTDQTPEIIAEASRRSTLIKTINISYTIPGLSGKANAIAQGMEVCSGEIVLVTDGDCRVPRTWAKAHAGYYDRGVGMVGGFTLLDERHDGTALFGKVQSLDWSYLLTVGSGAIGMGTPLSVLGNNFSFRRQAYEQVGGYRNMGFTIIEDFALMKRFVKRTPWKVLYPIDPNMLVYSHPMATFRAFHQQRKRWSAGGKEVGLYGKFLMLISVLVHLLLPASLFVIEPAIPLLSLAVILASDFTLLRRSTGLVKRRDLLRFFPLWECFYFFYTTFFTPVLLLPTTVTWKNVSYSWKFNWRLKGMSSIIPRAAKPQKLIKHGFFTEKEHGKEE